MSKERIVLVVAPGKSVMSQAKGGLPVHLKEGDILRSEDPAWMKRCGLTKKDIDKWVKNGRVQSTVISNRGEVTLPARDVQQIVPTVPGSPSGEGLLDSPERPVMDSIIPPPTGDPTMSAPLGQANGKWGFDPSTLTSNSIEELNGLVMRIDPQMPPFETTEEAVAQLSKDFQTAEGQVARS